MLFPLQEGQENVQVQPVEIGLQNTSAPQINEPVTTEQDSDQLQDCDTGNKENQDPDDTIDLEQAGFVVLDSLSNETDQPNSSERSIRKTDLPDRSKNNQLTRDRVQALSDRDIYRLVRRLAEDNKVCLS